MGQRYYDVAILADTTLRLSEAASMLGSMTSMKLINIVAPPAAIDFMPRLDLVNVDMRSLPSLTALKAIFARLPQSRRARFVAVDQASHIEVTRGHALGATGLLDQPLDRRQVVQTVLNSLKLAEPPPPLAAGRQEVTRYAGSLLRDILMSVRVGAKLPLDELDGFSGTLVDSIAADSLSTWLAAMRRNHSATFEHCLTVTATAVAFGLEIGAGSKDLLRLAAAAMAHDVGKAFIPVEILEKPGKLDERESAMVRLHPMLGYEALKKADAAPALLDVALNHHEYLDGSGYPNGISGPSISDITRVMTIADIFSALIERRAYKPPMEPMRAYQLIEDLGPKLDIPLVRAFRPIAERLSKAAPVMDI